MRNFCENFESSFYATGRNGAAKLHRAAGRFESQHLIYVPRAGMMLSSFFDSNDPLKWLRNGVKKNDWMIEDWKRQTKNPEVKKS